MPRISGAPSAIIELIFAQLAASGLKKLPLKRRERLGNLGNLG